MRPYPALVYIIFSLVSACDIKGIPGGEMAPNSPVTIRINEQGKSFAGRHAGQLAIDRQPAGLDFYEIHWKTRSPGAVNLEHGRNTFKIDRVLSISGYQDNAFPAEGILSFSITASLSPTAAISHDDARIALFQILKAVHRLDWQVTIPRSRPRLRGRDMMNYLFSTGKSTTLDVGYLPSIDEWMRLENGATWAFYANGLFLEISFMRDPTLGSPLTPGVYLVNFDIQSALNYYRQAVPTEARPRWKDALSNEMAELASIRVEAEKELKKKGISIDEKYIDPAPPTE